MNHGPFAADADQVVAQLAAGNFAAVSSKFDATMTSSLPTVVLANNWRTFQETLGSYRSHDEPTSVTIGQLVVERVPVTMANGKGEVRVTFHPDATIAGLFFLNGGVPPP